jgi:hypothetical protein
MKITHQKISPHPNPDDGDTVGGEDWNAPHTLSGGRIVGGGWMDADTLRLAGGAGIEIVRQVPEGWDDEPGIFLLRLRPSAGVKFGTVAEAFAAGIFVDFEPRLSVVEMGSRGSLTPFPPGVAGIRVAFLWQYEPLRDEDGELVYVEDEYGNQQEIIDGYYYRAYAVDEEGYVAFEEEGEGKTVLIDPTPWMALKITVWWGVFEGGYNPDGSDDPPVPGDGY